MSETDAKAKRPKFSAPKPPVGSSDDVVVNTELEHPVTDTVIEPLNEPVNAVAVDTGSPPPKTVSRYTSSDDVNSLDSVLSEKTSAKIEPISPPAPSANQASKKEARGCNPLLVGISAFSLIIGIAGWVLYFSTTSQINIFGGSNAPEPTTLPAALAISPTPTTTSKAAIPLEVLNGSGVSGLAGKTADTLEGMGYTILKTGNADNSNYKTTEIYTNPEFTDTKAFLEDLEEEFGSATVSGSLKDSTASARIIVGKDWAE